MLVRGLFPALVVMIGGSLSSLAAAQTPAQPSPTAPIGPAAPASMVSASGVMETSAASDAPDPNYVLGPDDVVEIEVLGRADFRARVRIQSDGKIQLPYLGDVEASNRTAKQLGEQVAQALEAGGYFAKPVMRVEIVGYASRYVTVLGAIGAPGLLPMNRAYRLSEIVARVGGVRADGADYIIIRSADGEENRYPVKAMSMGGASDDPYVAAGDKIFVPTAEVFFISGQINAPGAYPVGLDLTFRTAIARGGGLTQMGTERRVKVTRGGKEIKKVDLDSKVLPGDIIVIGERLF